MKNFIAFIIFSCCLNIAECFAQLPVTDSSISIKDNSIYSESNNSSGAATNLFAGKSGLSNNRRALVKFSALSIQPDSFKSVTVRVFVNQVSNDTIRTLSLHKLTSDWGEGTSTGAGSGGAPTTGDATWNYKFYNTQTWTTPGGDYQPAASATIQVGNTGYYTFSDAKLLEDYRSWVNNPSSNFGWIIIGAEGNNNSSKRLSSKESGATTAPKIFATYNPTVVPVTLSKMNVSANENVARLTWQTLAEFNSSTFKIEHSFDGFHFSEAGSLPAAGNSNKIINYSFDHTTSYGLHYYRLIMSGINGNQQVSNTVSVNIRQKRGLIIYPNPVYDLLKIEGISSNNPATFKITDSQGRKQLSGLVTGNEIPVQRLRPGYYVIHIEAGSKVFTSGFLKK